MLFHPSSVEPSDPYRLETQFAWPGNLLLAATLVEGPTTLPVAPDIWSNSVLIQVDLEGAAGLPLSQASDTTELDPSGNLLGALPSVEHSDWIQETVPFVRRVAERYEGGLRTLLTESAPIHQMVTKGVIVPFLASIENEGERRALTKATEKVFGTSLETWISAARRRLL